MSRPRCFDEAVEIQEYVEKLESMLAVAAHLFSEVLNALPDYIDGRNDTLYCAVDEWLDGTEALLNEQS